MPLIATRGNASAGGYGWSLGVSESLDGMVLMTPTSVDKAGTGSSATIGANGSVTYSACTSLSLNGVFTADYDNYMVVLWGNESTNTNYVFRFRASGTDNSTASSYVYQQLVITGTVEAGGRTTQSSGRFMSAGTDRRNGFTAYVYGPYIAQQTAWRTVVVGGASGGEIDDHAGTHNQSTAYDGFTLLPDSSANITGLVSVYGLEN